MTDNTRINSLARNLPAFSIADSINQTLRESANLVVTAPPGAGKSTLLPLTILEGMNGKGKILMLEPRRLAARQIAERMASLIGEPAGKTVGYRVRFENKVRPRHASKFSPKASLPEYSSMMLPSRVST